jgi:hypothetical protein
MEDSLFAMVFERSQNFTTFLYKSTASRCKKEDGFLSCASTTISDG